MPGAEEIKNLQNLKSGGQTFKQIFEDVSNGIGDADAAMEGLMKKIQELKDFDDERVETLKNYLDGLDDVNEHWEDITDFIENSLDSSKEYLFRTEAIRGSLSSILNDLSSTQTLINNGVRSTRTLVNLSGELDRAIRDRGPLDEKSLASLSKRVDKSVEEYEYTVRRLANLRDDEKVVNSSEETKQKILNAQQKALEKAAYYRNLSTLYTGKERNEYEKLAKLQEQNAELLDPIHASRVRGIQETKDGIKNLRTEAVKSTEKIGTLAEVLNKFGAKGLSERVEAYRQERTRAGARIGEIQTELSNARVDLANAPSVDAGRVATALENQNAKQINYDSLNADLSRNLEGTSIDELRRLSGDTSKDHRGRSANGRLVSSKVQDEATEKLGKILNLQQQIRVATEEKVKAEKLYSDAVANSHAATEEATSRVSELEDRLKKAQAEQEENKKGTFELLTGITPAMTAALGTAIKTGGAMNAANKGAAGFIGKIPGVGKVAAIGKAMGPIFGALASTLTGSLGPAAILAKIARDIWVNFKQVTADAAELKRRVGSWEIGTAAVNSKLATSIDWLKTATELSDQLGLNSVTLFNDEQIASAAEFKNLTGASAEMANNLLVRSKLVGQTTDHYRDSLAKGANEGNRLNHSVVTLREVQNGVLKASDATALSYGNNAEALGRAVVAAKNLGMELSGIEKMSDSLLNFESSIANEMEAQLMTGMQLNLSKAREFALENNLEGVAEEIQRQGVTAAKFTNMNRIQQESMAKALGMSREELAKSLILRQLNNGASAEALAAATNMTKEQIEAMGWQQRWQIMTQKLLQSITPLGEILIDILDPLAKIASFVSNIVGWVSNLISSVLRLLGLVDKIPSAFGFSERFNKGNNVFTERDTNLRKQKREATFNEEDTSSINEQIRENSKQQKAYEASLVSFGKSGSSSFVDVTKSAGNFLMVSALLGMTFPKLAASSARFFGGMIRGAKNAVKSLINLPGTLKNIKTAFSEGLGGVKNVTKASTATTAEKVAENAAKGPAVVGNRGKGLVALGRGIAGFFRAFNSVTMGSIGKALLAGPVLVAMTPFMLVVPALAAAGKLARTGLPALGQGIAGFFKALGKVGVEGLVIGGLVVGALTLAAMGIGKALQLAAPGIEALGNVILKTLQGIGIVIKDVSEAFVTGFTGISEAIKTMNVEDIGKLALIGPALFAFGASTMLAVPGLVAFGALGLPVLAGTAVALASLTSNVEGIDATAVAIRNLAGSVKELGSSLRGIGLLKLLALRGTASIESKHTIQESGKVEEQALKEKKPKKAEPVKKEEKQVDLAALQNQLSQVIILLKEGQTIDFDMDKFYAAQSRKMNAFG